MYEMQPLTVDIGRELVESIELGLDPAPVEAVDPIIDELFEIARVGAELPRRSDEGLGPARPAQTAIQVVEHRIGNRDLERLHQRVGHEVGHKGSH